VTILRTILRVLVRIYYKFVVSFHLLRLSAYKYTPSEAYVNSRDEKDEQHICEKDLGYWLVAYLREDSRDMAARFSGC
jgi:hypothetical protein